jgi:DNA-directed RNA polymerase subunit L/DNA-directed RNA polymerase alpha subunit
MFTNYTEDESSPPLLNRGDHKLAAQFVLYDTNVTVANTLRRAIQVQTPTVGFRTEPYEKSGVSITINTTPLVNEMIAHRVGMIPINLDPRTFNPDHWTFVLDVENKGKEIRDVRASDFKVYKRDPKRMLEEPEQVPTELVFPPDPLTGDTVLITRLRPQWNPTAPNERIQLSARAVVGTGAENIRWSPVSQASYEFTLDPDEAHLQEVFTKWLARNKKIENLADLEPARLEDLKAEFKTMEIQRCFLTDAAGNPNNFTFHVESVGIQSIPTIVHNALVSCVTLVKKYIDIDGGALPSNVRIQAGDSRYMTSEFWFTNESHTLGNLLATWLVDNKITDTPDNVVTYAGYKVPHPLRPEMFVRVGIKEGSDKDVQQQSARQAVAEACRELKKMFEALTLAWDHISGLGPVEEVAEEVETPASSAEMSAVSANTRSSANTGSSSSNAPPTLNIEEEEQEEEESPATNVGEEEDE